MARPSLTERAARLAAQAHERSPAHVDRSDPESLRDHDPHGPDEPPSPDPDEPVSGGAWSPEWTEWPTDLPVIEYTCPRCREAATGRFYGPCQRCVDRLRETAPAGEPGPHARTSRQRHDVASTVADRSVDGAHITTRRRREYRQRHSVFMRQTATVGELLSELTPGVERVYLIGDRLPIAELTRWALGELPEGWEHDAKSGHYLEGNLPVLKYRHDGRAVELHRAAAWFGEGRYSTDDARRALAHFGKLLAATFDGAGVLATPATTGREAFLRTIPHDSAWPVLSDEAQRLVRSTSGQGRIELVGRSCSCGSCLGFVGDELPSLVEYDGRLMYGALCWGLPIGPATHDERPEFAEHQRGRYRVTFTVPDDWRHVGLLPVMIDGGWHYPNEPGSSWETWCDGAELLVAQRNGWSFAIHERLLFGTGQPLDLWAKRFVKMRAAADHQAAVGMVSPEIGQLVAAAVRNVLLHSIGAFHAREHVRTKVLPLSMADTLPVNARNVRFDGAAIVFGSPTEQRWPELAHPEWPAAVWARARARLLAGPRGVGALGVPASSVVGFRTDALYLTERQPAWEAADDGAAGRLRMKRNVPGPIPAPSTHVELLQARAANGS